MSTFEKLSKAAAHFENWPMRVLEWLRLLPARRVYGLRIRRGPIFYVRPFSSDAAFVQSITREGEYFPYFGVLPGDVVVDVGANIGSFAVWVGFREPTARVVAVEPMDDNVRLLEKNIAANGLANVMVVRGAIARLSGQVTLYPGKGTWFGSGSVTPSQDVQTGSPVTVPAMTLAELFAAHNVVRCDFLKMDCEGAEYAALAAVPDDVWKRIKKIALEYHEFPGGGTRGQLISLLESKGYRVIVPRQYEKKKIGLLFAVRS